MNLKISSVMEWAYVSLFCIFLLYIGMAVTMDYRLQHTFPYGFSSSDAYGEVAYTEGIIDSGSYEFLPYYIRYGFDDTLGFHMPISNDIFALFSMASGLPVWDSIMIIGFLFSIFSILAMYLLIRNFNRNVALISIALGIFLYVRNFSVVYTWGQWDVMMATFMVICGAWVLDRFELKKSYMLFAILAGGAALTHITEAVFLLFFAIAFFGMRIIIKKFSFADFKKIAMSGIIALVLSFYYLIIFKVGYAAGGVDSTLAYQAPQWYDVMIGQFGFFQYLIFAGILVSILLLFTKKEGTALLFGIFMLLIGFSNISSSLAPRAFQTRYFWPLHLAVLLGIAPYFIFKHAIKNWKIIYSIGISAILAFSITYVYYQKSTSPGIAGNANWEHILWVRDNTQKDARILYFYGDAYTQEAFIWNNKRVSYRIPRDDLVAALNERKIKRIYNAEVAAADDTGLLYRKSAFSFGYHAEEINDSYYFGSQDICKFDYFVLDKVSAQPVLAQYNLLIASQMMRNGTVTQAFDNGAVIILKNNDPGGNCIEEGNF